MKKKLRKAKVIRKTKETEIKVILNIDGRGSSAIETGIGILDHLLELFAFHGFFDLEIRAKGDLRVDTHHTNEDIGIVLGQAFREALGAKKGIKRFAFAYVPMEDVLTRVVVDISGRSFFKFDTDKEVVLEKEGYHFSDAQHFLEAFTKNLGMHLHLRVEPVSLDLHTLLEPVFKALGLALDEATQIDRRRKSIPSTKGIID